MLLVVLIKRCLYIIDAAHCHSPVGGQGLNLGIQDGTLHTYLFAYNEPDY